MDNILEELLFTDKVLHDEEIFKIAKEAKNKTIEIENLNKRKIILELALYYNEIKKQGISNKILQKYYKEDKQILKESLNYLEDHLEARKTMFGYPANMNEFNPIEKALRNIEANLYLINSCGGPNPETDSGNYKMDSKKYEMKIIELFCENMNVNKDDYWGYINAGGTEGNFWGIRTGFEIYPNATLYYSDISHYSIEKSVKIGYEKNIFPNKKIKTTDEHKIDCD